MNETEPAAKRPPVSLTPKSRVRVYSAGGAKDSPFVSTGLFRGLVSVGGENSLALELEGEKEKGQKDAVRLLPLNAILAIDILVAAKAEEEKRADPAASAAYFR